MMPTMADLINQLEVAQVNCVVPIKFPTAAGTPNNEVDVATALLLESDRTIDDIDRLTYGGKIAGIASPYSVNASGELVQSSRVYKVGRTTGFTEGEVVGINAVAPVQYTPGVANFVNQLVIAPTADNVGPFSDRGDSGSGILNDDHELVGLLYAGNNQHTFANPIGLVMAELRATMGINSLRLAQ